MIIIIRVKKCCNYVSSLRMDINAVSFFSKRALQLPSNTIKNRCIFLLKKSGIINCDSFMGYTIFLALLTHNNSFSFDKILIYLHTLKTHESETLYLLLNNMKINYSRIFKFCVL